jgi:hypothetical protein
MAARSPLVPHVAFWAVGLLAKLVFPVYLKWLAYDSITTLLLSVWYPLCATISLIHRNRGLPQQHQNDTSRSSKDGGTDSFQTERQFWIEYWSVGFAGVQFLHHSITLVPSLQQMGRHDYPQLPVLLNEIKLLFFVWIFIMETLLARYQRYLGVDERKENWKKFVPLTFLTKAIGPRLMRVQIAMSEQISKDTWQRLIQRKAQRVLEVLVVLQFLEERSMDYFLKLLEEGRSLLLLSVFMVLPSSITQVGMLYAQFIFPSARSLAVRGDAMEVLSLKYWVLNNILSLFLSVSWWLWWCIPLSNQLILGIRCFATFPSTITHYYSMVEMELITFGILTGEQKLTVKETKTIQALRAVVRRLPRDKQAQSFQFEIDEPLIKSKDDDDSIDSVDTTESERERRRKRRREKKAKKQLLKQKNDFYMRGDEGKYSSFINSNESDDSKSNYSDITPTLHNQYSLCSTEKEERDARDEKRAEVTLNSFSDDTNTLIPAPSFSTKSSMKSSDLDEDSDRALLPSMTIGSNYSSSQIHSDSRLIKLNIATPTESIVDEVEVRFKATTGRSKSIFPATYPRSTRINLVMPLPSNEEELCLKSSMSSTKALSSKFQSQSSDNDNNNDTDSRLDLSDVDTAASSTIEGIESFESWSPLHEASNGDTRTPIQAQQQSDGETTKTANVFVDLDEMSTPPRRSSRLVQLQEWQEQKRQEESKLRSERNESTSKSSSSSKQAKKSKTSEAKVSTTKEKSKREGSPEKVSKKSSKSLSVYKKTRKSTTVSVERSKKQTGTSLEKGEKKSMVTSPKRSPKKSKIKSPERESTFDGKRVKKKSLAASPDKTTRSSERKDEAPLQDDTEGVISSPSSSSSPRKTSRNKQSKIPNSRRKKKDLSTMFGGVLSRK